MFHFLHFSHPYLPVFGVVAAVFLVSQLVAAARAADDLDTTRTLLRAHLMHANGKYFSR